MTAARESRSRAKGDEMRQARIGAIERMGLLCGLLAVAVPGLAQTASSPAVGQGTGLSTSPALELSMEEAIRMALESNLGLASQELATEGADYAVAASRASFMPSLTSSLNRTSSRSSPTDFTQGALDISNQNLNGGLTWNHALPWLGSTYRVSWTNQRSTQTGGFPTFSPRLGSSFSLNVTQPLLRGFLVDSARAGLTNSQRRRAIADLQLEQQMIGLEAQVQLAYLDLASAIEGLNVARENMAIREQSLDNARARVAVGAAAQIDVISAEADVASNQEAVLIAQAQIATREDALRTLIFDPERPDFWDVRLVPTDSIVLDAEAVDLAAAIANALSGRLDLQIQRRQVEISDLDLQVSRNATRPGLDFTFNYQATGTGGTRFAYSSGFPPTVVSRTDRGFGSVLGDAFGGAYPTWTVGLNVSYPVGPSAAQSNYAQATVSRRQDDLQLRQLELTIVQQVREAARQVENSYQRVLATQAALRASEQQLEAEQRRFAVGLSTTLELQTRQSQLASARTQELNATIAYNRALINFERVQRAP